MTAQKFTRCLALLLTAFAISISFAYAQSTTQGAITGTVEDSTGAVVPNAIVLIHNNGTNADRTLTADGSGYFKDPLAEPGVYTVTVTAPNFEKYESTNVVVQVGQATTLEPKLKAGAETTTVEVTAQAPVLNFESPDFSSNLNSKAIENIPINNRRWSALALSTPGVVSDSNGFGLVSVRGISPILNDVLIDGADDNQAYFAEERGRTREAYSTSASAVREFAVNTGVYAAQYGRAAGAVINSVTKSGGNEIHGEAYFYDRESKWNAFNDYTKLTPVSGTGTGTVVGTPIPLKPKDLRKIFGFTADGAIIKDKLFWAYTFDEHRRAFPGIGIANSTSFYNLPDPALPAGATFATNGYITGGGANSLDSQIGLLAIRLGYCGTPSAPTPNAACYAQGATAYDNGISALTTDLGRVPRFGDQEINTPKLDWQINPKERVSFLFHRLRWDSPGGVQTQGALDYGVDTWGNDFVKLDYGLTKLTSLITSHISNELLYQYSRELDDESQQPFSNYTKNNLVGTGATGATGNVPEVLLDNSVFANIGSPYYSYRTAYPDERKWQIGDVLNWNRGNHNFAFGVDTVHNYDLLNNLYEANGYITYGYLGNYFADQIVHNTGGTLDTCGTQTGQAPTSATTTGWTGNLPCYSNTQQGLGASPEFAIATTDYGFFGQDNWKVSPTLTLELGVRYDYESIPAPSATLTAASGTYVPFPGVTNRPSDKNNIGIRVGFSKDVYGNGETVLRGGYGMFYGRLANSTLLNTELNTGSTLGQYVTTFTPAVTGGPTFPNLATTGSAPVPGAYYFAPNLQNPMVHEYDLIVQQQLGHSTVMSVSYLGALGRELPNFLDKNLDPTTVVNHTITTVAGSNGSYGPLGSAQVFNVPTYTKYGNTALFGPQATSYQNITEVVSNINSSYNAAVFEVQNRSLKSVQFDFNYTWSHALDFDQNAQTATSAEGWLDPYSNNAHQNYGNSNYNVPNRFTGYVLYNLPGFSGHAWYTYLTNGWKIDDSFQMQNGLPYSAGTSGSNGTAVTSGWYGSGGLAIVPALGVNTFKYPRKIVDDARIEKDITYEKYSLELFAQMFNVANHQNIDGLGTTAYKLAGSGAAATLTFQNATWQVPTSSNNSGFLYTPRQIEIAARFRF
jgi:hypothetical protein